MRKVPHIVKQTIEYCVHGQWLQILAQANNRTDGLVQPTGEKIEIKILDQQTKVARHNATVVDDRLTIDQ